MNFITPYECGVSCHAGSIASIGTYFSRNHISDF